MSRDICLCVDKRGRGEGEVYEAITFANKTLGDLPVGDYQFMDRSTNEVFMIVERKTHMDLAASIKSKHMQEQLARMNETKSTHPQVIICLLLEGPIGSDWFLKATDGFPNTNLEMFLTSIALRGDIVVQYTASIRHTASWLSRMGKRIQEGKLRQRGSQDPQRLAGAHISSLVSRADTRTKNNQWARLLACIDGVSGEKALEIAKEFPSPFELVMYCKEVGRKQAVKRASDITIRKRRIGPTLAQRIVDMFSEH